MHAYCQQHIGTGFFIQSETPVDFYLSPPLFRPLGVPILSYHAEPGRQWSKEIKVNPAQSLTE